MEEHPLSGGNASGDGAVVRVGDTVRKPWTRSTPAVHALLASLRDRGVDVPRPLGRDDRGRQVLEFVAGPIALDRHPLPIAELPRVGALIRGLHDACATIDPPRGDRWGDVLIPAPDAEPDLVCHNDLGPWNLVVGDRWVFIDWDGAGPSTRVWDLAYAAQGFADLTSGRPVDQAVARLAAIADGYGADERMRDALADALPRRTREMYEVLAAAHREGREPWSTMFVEGHGEHWRTAAQYVAAHAAAWRDGLRQPPWHGTRARA